MLLLSLLHLTLLLHRSILLRLLFLTLILRLHAQLSALSQRTIIRIVARIVACTTKHAGACGDVVNIEGVTAHALSDVPLPDGGLLGQ